MSLKLNQVMNLQFSFTDFHPFLSLHGSLDVRHAGLITMACLKSIQANPVNQEKTQFGWKTGIENRKLTDSLHGSVEDTRIVFIKGGLNPRPLAISL